MWLFSDQMGVGGAGGEDKVPSRVISKRIDHTRFGTTVLLLGILAFAPSCAPIRGFPYNFQDNDETIARLTSSAETAKAQYDQTTDPRQLTILRNRAIFSEMQISEIYFTDFQYRLWGDNNLFTTGSDLVILVLGGLGATTGSATTKSALAAASAGIVGARGAISKDIYYQRTLPAILAQMSANRDKIKASMLYNLNKDDSSYPLAQAEMDLQVLQRASGIADAVQSITEVATAAKDAAAARVDAARQGIFSRSLTTQRIQAWIGFGIDPATGREYTPNPSNLKALQDWVNEHVPGLPVQQLLVDTQNAEMEQNRQRAIADLKIP